MTETPNTQDAVDRLVGGYLLLSGAALLFPHHAPGWVPLLIFHLGAGAILVSGGAGRARRHVAGRTFRPPAGVGFGLARVFLDWYPLLLFPFLYWELPYLSGAIWGERFFDSQVLGWEEALFGGQPSATLAIRFPFLLLSELLHGSYVSYYLLIYALPLVLYLRGRIESYRSTVFALMLALLGTYVVFVVFPVQGPRYLFPAPEGGLERGPLYRTAHWLLEAGSSRGAAFPSAHAAVSALQTVNTYRYLPKATPVVAALTAGLSLGAVYGGFHYGVDILVGLATGLALGAAAPRIRTLFP